MSLDQLPLASIEDEDEDDQSSSSSDSETDLVGFFTANIVGMQYYSGRIAACELVSLVRETSSRYDPNSISVLNTRNIQVGHIEKKVASVLAPLIDSGLINVDGVVSKTQKNSIQFQIQCHVLVFAKTDSFETVKSVFLDYGLILLNEIDETEFSTSESMVVKEEKTGDVDEISMVVKEKETGDVDEIDDKLSQNAVNGVIEPPKDLILPDLFLHQKEGLYWLYHRENSDVLPPFWEEKDQGFVNVLTNYQTDKRPDPLRGGIFADDMGLGKTLTLLSLVALDKCNVSNDGKSELKEVEHEPLAIVGGKRSRHETEEYTDRADPKMTLIVCTPSVFSNWMTQLTEHTKHGMLKTYKYYGERTQDVSKLQEYDIILTTYNTLGSELGVSTSPIKKIEWWRVILDEAHIIKNHKAKQSKAVMELNAKRRWVVTGTPIQNGSMDLFAFMVFLRLDPFSTKRYWHSLVQRPVFLGLESGLSRLQAIMAAISLRRTKEKTLTELPQKTVRICNVELSSEERQFYDEMEAVAKKYVSTYIERESVAHNYSTVLTIILRLRQICTHMALCPSDTRASLFSFNFEDASNNPKLLEKLLVVLQDGDDLDCPICLSPLTEIIITSCAHIFCKTCITQALKGRTSLCPLCRTPLSSKSDLFSPPPESTPKDDKDTFKSSSKSNVLLDLLGSSRNENPLTKSVVFSQFRKLLLLLEEPLKEAGFKTVRLDGVMTADRRADVIKEFGLPGGPTVLLASLKSAGTGINLTAASRVYLMEPWWNPAIEDQAMDRIHRIGQTQEVTVVKMIARNSIDERILLLQEKKQKLANEAFAKTGNEKKTEVELADLRTLMLL